jgi:hypothetical protein
VLNRIGTDLRPVALLLGCLGLGSCTDEVTPAVPEPVASLSCVPSTFITKKLDLPEASGAVWVESALGTGWLVGADNGNDGEVVLLGEGGAILAGFNLPLDEAAGDDLEGLAWSPSGRLVGLTSAGYLRQWDLDAGGPQLAQLAQAISSDPDWACAPQESNCGPNWEGLCLDPAPEEGGCAGFAVSKKRGELVCVRASGSGFVLDPQVRIDVTGKDQLSGCDYMLEAPHALVVAGNDEAENGLWVIDDPRNPLKASAHALEIGGTLNQEAVAFGPDGLMLSFGDEELVTGEGSAIVAFFCQVSL